MKPDDKRLSISVEYLFEILRYEPESGLFYWTDRAPHSRQGHIAGTKDVHGYIQIGIRKRFFKAHRLAWLFFYKKWPENLIDHANLIKDDNRISNLREATISQNYANSRPRSALGVKGVYVDKRRSKHRFKACICINGKTIHLGGYDTKEEAAAAYKDAAEKHHKEFARTNHA